MAKREKWLEQIKVVAKENIIGKEHFDEDEYEDNKEMIERRKIYLSPESIALDMYILAGLGFRIYDRCKEDVSWYITTRAKSPISSVKKQKRFDKQLEKGIREDSKIYDIIASNLVIEDILDEKEGLNSFSSLVKARYDERKFNIDLLAGIINFINEQIEIDSFYSEYDNKEIINDKIKVIHKSFNEDFGKNIFKYRKNLENNVIKRPPLEAHLNRIIQKLRIENSDKEMDKMYKTIRKWLITEQTMSLDVRDDQEEYYKYLIVLLYRLKNLEYEECVTSYNEIDDTLKGTLSTYANLIESGFNGNVTLEYIENLEKWCKKLNAQLNDRLENQIIEELMTDTMYLEFVNPDLSVSMEEKSDHTVDIDKQIKPNGYVALHGVIVQKLDEDLQLRLECKGMTEYRTKVATFGSASYGEKRLGKNNSKQEARKEKERPIYLMPKYAPQKYNLKDDQDLNLKKSIVIEGFGRLEDMTEEQRAKWRRNIEKVTPKYINTTYNKETDSIEFTFHSMYKNARIYFREINNRRKKHMVEEGFKIIKEEKLLDLNKTMITLTREQYEQFMQGDGLEKLVDNIKQNFHSYYEQFNEINGVEGPDLD